VAITPYEVIDLLLIDKYDFCNIRGVGEIRYIVMAKEDAGNCRLHQFPVTQSANFIKSSQFFLVLLRQQASVPVNT
jgi:hypothetical protein